MDATGKIRASKSKKKGGKGTQVISAADEARKREAIKVALRQKLDLERKALQVVERLLEDSVTEEFLIDCAWHITPANYKDTVEERCIAKLCGYPRCPNKLTNIPTQQFKISTKTNRVYDITERKCFCSNFCYKASKCFELQISKTPLWLRKEERPPEVKLMNEGEGGSSGQEIKLVDKPVTETDIENPVPDVPESHKDSPPFNQSDNSDTEQDFVSSVVSRQHKHTRVHWGKLPKRDGVSEDRLSAENERYAHPGPTQTLDGENNDESGSSKTPQPQTDPTACLSIPNKTTSAGSDVEGTLELLNQCSLKDTATQQETNLPSQSEIGNSTPPTSGLNITQVSMSKRGAAGLKGLLKDHNKAKTTPTTISLCLLEHLRQTFMEWRTEETMKFLYGPDYASGTEVSAQEVEELDEDDLDEAEVEVSLRQNSGSSSRPSASAPDFETLQKETELLELRVREFYKGTYVLPEEVKTDAIKNTQDTQDSGKDPPLPLVDSHAQHLIQKRIAVEKLSQSLRDAVGTLRLTMSDVINDINNLVRTFRFTNTNIIHKRPEWTLIAVVLLSVLTEVSPLLRESLASPSSLEYISSLMSELKLEDKDLHNLVLLFKPCVTPQT
ncbi:putative RNA polymerase II subunit B1 CTD phosphatase rpap2 isoform X2 [Sinocyclocheilus rhinocerous]|uniref:putative RNA polymerase II subunit B1 CTD phosphatase rpap2 isoform X2 n=1 Tax=Sinocyclocheilus rhinocerous TaxID=307959 RepID=UPI0007B87BE0|nr:PREDICTED: putative RNA polymerase II subunit B1 CTD phosphatase rpap2 isoform X2 [Sinocyclocheilus rhinocerous]